MCVCVSARVCVYGRVHECVCVCVKYSIHFYFKVLYKADISTACLSTLNQHDTFLALNVGFDLLHL